MSTDLSGSVTPLRPVGMTTPNRGRGSRKCSRNSRAYAPELVEPNTPGHSVLVEVFDEEEQENALAWDWYPNTRRASLLGAARDYPGCRFLVVVPCTWAEWQTDKDPLAPWTDEEVERAHLEAMVGDILDEVGV
jgi:hypothetical protein